MLATINNTINNNTTESDVKTALPQRPLVHILQQDPKNNSTFVDVYILDKKVRYKNVSMGYQLYEAIALSLKKIIIDSSVFAVINGNTIIPNTPDDLSNIALLSKNLYVRFGTQGENTLAQSWSVIWEKAVISSNMEVQASGGELQEDDGQQYIKNMTVFFTHIGKNLEALNIPEAPYWISQFNNLAIVYRGFRRCVTLQHYIDQTQVAYSLLSGRNAILDMVKYFTPSEVQSDTTEMLQALRGMFDTMSSVTQNPTVLKIRNLFSFALVHGYLKHIGLELNEEDYSKAEMRQMLSSYSSKKGFLFSVLDTSLYIAERLDAWYKTGDFMNFLHSEKLYTDWMKEADRLLHLGAFTNNLEALNNSSFKFRADLTDAISKGQAYVKYTVKTSGQDCLALKRKLGALELLRDTEITKRAAQAERIAPFGVLIHGPSCIAKSTFTRMLFHAYGSAFDLDRSDSSCYTRNSFDNFWSGFQTSQWCVRLDDIAFLNPAKCSEVDQSIVEMLCVVNNVPYVPDQAALEDKGTTPMMAKLVLATTNTVMLNTLEFFSCPLAVNRRLPYIIGLLPKKKYLQPNGKFIDSAKLENIDGEFPDFWEISVSKIKPVAVQGMGDRAELESVAEFSDVKLFLQHFVTAALDHEEKQKISFLKNADMSNIHMCKRCRMPLPHDECAAVQALELTYAEEGIVYFLSWFFSINFFVKFFVLFLSRYRISRYPIYAAINSLPARESVRLFARLDELRRDHRLRRLVACLGIVAVGVSTFITVSSVVKTKKSRPVVATPESHDKDCTYDADIDIMYSPSECVIEDNCDDAVKDSSKACQYPSEYFGVQADEDRLLETQIAKEEAANVWYQGEIKTTSWDLSLACQSLNGKTEPEIRDIIGNNCVAVRIKPMDGGYPVVLRGTFVSGQFLLLPFHAFKVPSNVYEVTVIKTDVNSSHSSNYTTTFRRGDLVVMENSDLCMLEIKGLPPHKDILKFFMTQDICPTRGFELCRQTDGNLDLVPFYNLRFESNMRVESLNISADVFMGVSSQETVSGMCGSVCVGMTPRGPVIIGLHLLGLREHVGFVAVREREIRALMQHPSFSSLKVQGGGSPMLTCSKRTYTVGNLHHRSLFRYLNRARLHIYGTLSGFRPNPKSKVCATPIQKEILIKYDREVAHGAPCMSGYHAVKQNVIHMVDPINNYNKSYLKECVDGFADEIIAGLPASSLKELIPLSTRAAINGLPGVKFVDGINRSTSMGFPFNTTKKGYLIEDKSDMYPDGVALTEEVLNEVERIRKCYVSGHRAYPVFNGNNKDEAVPLAKVIGKKCRLFTGSPLAWSIIVREKLLTFVRVMQKNSILFEAGPGTVCQSKQWGKIRKFLTKFGLDRIVAGDYGKFDKKMIADFILAAFDVIIRILRAAGWKEQELLEVKCMGFDIAFPVCNINGDLVEFFGTNPSGHPLTVIINSIVNSLYIRYCFKSLGVEAAKKHFIETGSLPADISVKNFKKFVSLFTYGDDNAMGVSVEVPWFNHTEIQRCLASIGVEYTMADKVAESVPYINIDDTSFLKRKWRWDNDVEGWMAPLEEDSIFKSLTMWVPSETIDMYAQTVFVVNSAVQEYFFYGREKFDEMRQFFIQLLEKEPYKHYVTNSTFPTFDQLKERFHSIDVNEMEVQSLVEDFIGPENKRPFCSTFMIACEPDYETMYLWRLFYIILYSVVYIFAFMVANMAANPRWIQGDLFYIFLDMHFLYHIFWYLLVFSLGFFPVEYLILLLLWTRITRHNSRA